MQYLLLLSIHAYIWSTRSARRWIVLIHDTRIVKNEKTFFFFIPTLAPFAIEMTLCVDELETGYYTLRPMGIEN